MSVEGDRDAGVRTYALDLVLLEVGDLICDHPWEAATEIDDLVHREGHDSCGEHVVLHVGIPCCPGLFEHIEVYIVLGDLLKVVGVRGR